MKKVFKVWGIDTMYIKNGYIAVTIEKLWHTYTQSKIRNIISFMDTVIFSGR